ncbi:MAG: branched-chain amino acid aminotransferase [Holosporales bacterium]|jgi:branched-chain amino acid aminotransferase
MSQFSNTAAPFDDRDGFIWVDGKFVPWREGKVHILTHGLHYASSVFEGLRVYDGKIFKLSEHSQRLIRSAELLDMKIPYSVGELNAATLATVEKQGVKNGYVRPVAWRGSEMMAIAAQRTTIHVAIASWETKTYYAPELLENGIALTRARYCRPAPTMAPTESKAAGLYMICTISKHEAERKGFQDALMLDYRGLVAEATGANIFMVIDGVLHTPVPDCFLNGITRQTVIQLAIDNGINVLERHIPPEDLSIATEVFLTGTAAELTPVGRLDELSFTPSTITKLLSQKYKELTKA